MNVARKAILATTDDERVVRPVQSGRSPRPILCPSVSLGCSRLGDLRRTRGLEDAVDSLSQLVQREAKRDILRTRDGHGRVGSVHVVALHQTSRAVDTGPC